MVVFCSLNGDSLPSAAREWLIKMILKRRRSTVARIKTSIVARIETKTGRKTKTRKRRRIEIRTRCGTKIKIRIGLKGRMVRIVKSTGRRYLCSHIPISLFN